MLLNKLIWLSFAIIGMATSQIIPTATTLSSDTSQSLIPRALLFDNPVKGSPRLSPYATQLAYLAPDENNVLNVWVESLTHKTNAKMVTADTKRGIRNFFWQYDEEHILYIQDKDGDENGHLYQTNILTRKTKDLTPYEGVKVGIVSYNPKYPHQALIQMNYRDTSLRDVYQLDLVSGALKLDTENPGNVIAWLADHHQVVRASLAMTDQGDKLISVRDNKQAPWRELLTITSAELGGDLIAFTADEKALYLLSSLGANTVKLLKIDVKTGAYQTLVENEAYDIEEVLINPLTHCLEGVGYEGEKHTLQAIDQELAQDLTWLHREADARFHIISRDIANKTWILAKVSDVHPTSYYCFSRADKKLTFLFSAQPALDNYTLSPMQPISYTARDGMLLHGYLTVPINKDAKNLPLVLVVHGGPWTRDNWGLNKEVQWLANRGYAVLQVNFRGSTGYGKKHLNAGNKEWGRKMHNDLLDGKQWAINMGIAHPDKIAIYGASYGGYATLAALAFTPEEFACGVDIVGPSNLVTLMQTLPPYWKPLKAQMDLRVGCLETEPEFLKACSPLIKAHQIIKPLLIAQGANDPRVKQAESDQIVDAMRQNKLMVEYLLFPDEGHGFARPQNRLKFYAAAEAFLAKYLHGHVEPPAASENWQMLLH